MCAFRLVGFLRQMTRPRVGHRSLPEPFPPPLHRHIFFLPFFLFLFAFLPRHNSPLPALIFPTEIFPFSIHTFIFFSPALCHYITSFLIKDHYAQITEKIKYLSVTIADTFTNYSVIISKNLSLDLSNVFFFFLI